MQILRLILFWVKNFSGKTESGIRVFTTILMLVTSVSLNAQTPSASQIKAVFLFNFTQFVEWPPNSFPEAQSSLVIGILGEDPFGSYLDEIVHDEKSNGYSLVVQRYQTIKDVKPCHILFINFSKKDQVAQVLENLRGQSILLVSDAQGFAEQGGMVQFITENNKIRFQINLEAVKAVNLSISSKLLRLAKIVAPKNN